jgi:hypothetical protein
VLLTSKTNNCNVISFYALSLSLLQDDADDGDEILDIDCENVAKVMVRPSTVLKAHQVAEVHLRQMPKCLLALGVQQSQQNRCATGP